MKKKGFTLIELLAVIVVLAIIALIATPIVMNTIEKAKRGAAERSADNYIDAVETTVATKRLEGNILEGTYTINDKGNLTGNGLTEPLVIEMNGNKPTSGTVIIKDGQVTTDTTMTIGDYDIAYNPTTKKYEATKKLPPKIVYSWSTQEIKVGDIINISDTSRFATNPIDIKDTYEYTTDGSLTTRIKKYYLKHVLDKDNKVTKTYTCSELKGKEYCLTNGEYGWSETESDYTGNALILKQIEDTKIEGVSCTFSAESSNCYDGDSSLSAYPSGMVYSASSYGPCKVNEDGSSYCGI